MELKPFISRIVSEIGPRPAGSESELKTGDIIVEELRQRGAEVSTHDAYVCPEIIRGLINLMIGGYLVTAIIYPFLPLLSSVITISLLILFILSRAVGIKAIDWLFQKGTTRNIIGKYRPKGRRPKGGAEKILIFSGHHDSPYNMPLFSPPYKAHAHTIENLVTYGFILIIPGGILRTIFTGLYINFPISIGWWDLFYVISILGLFLGLFYRSKMLTKELNLGANDNLSAISVLLGIADYLKDNPPSNTEVWLISFGSEEPSLYGSHGFALEHKEEIKDAFNINLETLGAGELAIIVKENLINLPYSPEAVDLIISAGKKTGLDLEKVAITYGSTDSASIVKNGGKSACLFGMDETKLFALWHTPDDNVENISEEKLQSALAVCLNAIDIVEKVEKG